MLQSYCTLFDKLIQNDKSLGENEIKKLAHDLSNKYKIMMKQLDSLP